MESLIPYDDRDATPIQQFYNKKSIFMTGGTGFLGKVIMEKLLRSCTIETIYILIRSKKDKDVKTRLGDIFNDPLFDKIRSEKPDFHHRIVGITGDCVLPELGISSSDRTILQQNVSIVFHVAATVRFDEKLKLALSINVIGTKEVINLCRELKDLKAFVHVSTAYANCNQINVDEQFYEPPISGDKLIAVAANLDENMLDIITPELIKGFPNTYTYTKCLAEDYVRSNSKGLPVAVFRPAIVIPTYKEPVQGWIDNMYGPIGVIAGIAGGIIRVLYANKKLNAEVVPVDMCVNSLLATAWDISKNRYEEPPIYNYVTSDTNSLTWGDYSVFGLKHGSKAPMPNSIWYYTVTVTSSKLLATILTFFYHILPAFFIDAGLFVVGKKPKMLQIYKKVHKFGDAVSYFNNTRFTFKNKNVMNLWKKLGHRDQEIFYFNMDTVDWNVYIEKSLIGLRKYLFKEDEKSIPKAYKRMMKLKALHYTLVYALYTIFGYFIYSLVF